MRSLAGDCTGGQNRKLGPERIRPRQQAIGVTKFRFRPRSATGESSRSPPTRRDPSGRSRVTT